MKDYKDKEAWDGALWWKTQRYPRTLLPLRKRVRTNTPTFKEKRVKESGSVEGSHHHSDNFLAMDP